MWFRFCWFCRHTCSSIFKNFASALVYKISSSQHFDSKLRVSKVVKREFISIFLQPTLWKHLASFSAFNLKKVYWIVCQIESFIIKLKEFWDLSVAFAWFGQFKIDHLELDISICDYVHILHYETHKKSMEIVLVSYFCSRSEIPSVRSHPSWESYCLRGDLARRQHSGLSKELHRRTAMQAVSRVSCCGAVFASYMGFTRRDWDLIYFRDKRACTTDCHLQQLFASTIFNALPQYRVSNAKVFFIHLLIRSIKPQTVIASGEICFNGYWKCL